MWSFDKSKMTKPRYVGLFQYTDSFCILTIVKLSLTIRNFSNVGLAINLFACIGLVTSLTSSLLRRLSQDLPKILLDIIFHKSFSKELDAFFRFSVLNAIYGPNHRSCS